MSVKILGLYVFLLLTPVIWAQNYSTNPNRTQTVKVLCVSFQDRSQLVSDASAADAEQYKIAMKASFSVTGNQLFGTVLQSMDPNSILTNYPKLPQEYGLFVGPFAVCLFVLMFTCLCTCCCCCCPAGCPPCGCCRKPMGETYSKCQLIWPSIVLLMALGLILAAGAVGLSKSKDVQTTIQAVGCSVSIILDDIINGNVTDSGKFFVGIRTLAKKIDTIKVNLNSVQGRFNSLSSLITAYSNAYTTVRTSIDNIPSNSAGSRAAGLNYNTPMDGTSTTSLLPSTFPADLGSTNIADSLTPLYIAYDGLSQVHTPINQILTQVTSVTGFNQATFTSALDQAKGIVSDVAGKLESGDKMYYDIYSQVNPYLSTISTAITGIYGGLIGIACVGMLATLLLLICNLYKCRFLLYFTCCILLLVGIISLLLATIISTLIPILYFTCDFTTYSFSSAANFNSNFGPITSLLGVSNLTSMVTVCLPGQSGDFLSAGAISSYTSELSTMSEVLNDMNVFDTAAIETAIDGVWNPAKAMVEDTYAGKRLDFSSQVDVDALNRISDPTSSSPGCAATRFASDSWIPSTLASSTIACKGGFTNSATNTQCDSANLQGAINNCYGCMDAMSIYRANSGTIATDLPLRYPGCSTWINQLNSINTNFFAKKQTYFTNILTRKDTAVTNIASYKTSITNLKNQFTTVIDGLKTSADTIFDPNYGVMAGLNCALFGQDILLLNNVACINGFTLLFFIRAAFGIAGFGALFTMYCAACTGVRHFKQSQAKKKSKPNEQEVNQTRQDLYHQEKNPKQNINNSIHRNNNYVVNEEVSKAKISNKYLQKDYATIYQNQLSFK